MEDQIRFIRGVGRASFRFIPREHERSHFQVGMAEPILFALLPNMIIEIATFVRDLA